MSALRSQQWYIEEIPSPDNEEGATTVSGGDQPSVSLYGNVENKDYASMNADEGPVAFDAVLSKVSVDAHSSGIAK